ncbi:MAG: magnesium transporter [Pirellulales bacterium]|jgi:magnesium transporter|nr:magnesium transporter [Thermoguttaceae bacterium]MDD4786920.1 magnesium transporter [Pirellulales bacterium]MDI9445300.1 magnesium transporter [Planctomycetota bacterium]NLY99424.1 magnesium transporter [Pirellulaceae bacterium]
MINTLYLPELREMLATHDAEGLREFCTALHPGMIAEFMEGLTGSETWAVLQHADAPLRAEIYGYLDQAKQIEICETQDRDEIAALIGDLPPDDRVDLLTEVAPSTVEELMPLVSVEDRRDIRRLSAYPEGTAGAVMTTAFARVREDFTARQALDEVIRQAAELETIYYVYVVDEASHLQGVVSSRQLFSAMRRPETPVRDLMEREVLTVLVTDDQEDVAQKVARFDFLAIPVVDDEHHIVGIITHDDVIDVMVEEATEDAHRMGGIAPITEDILEARFTTIWRKRALWLSVLFVAELFTFSALAQFEQAIAAVVALSLFLPLVISTGGNSGSQAATLITRALALGQVTTRDWFRVFRHEVLMGLTLGLTLGVIAYVRAALTPQSVLGNADRWTLACVIAQAVALICLWGTLVGSMLPLVFKRLGIDPGIASSPFVATFVDVTGILIYFSIAEVYLLH